MDFITWLRFLLGCVYCTWILCYTTCCAMTFSLIPFKNRNIFLSSHSPSFTHHLWLNGFTKRTGNDAQNSARRNWMLLSSGMWHRAVCGRNVPTFHSLYCFLRQGCRKCFGKWYFSTRLKGGGAHIPNSHFHSITVRAWNLIEKIGWSCNEFDLYPGSIQFESWLGHCLSWKSFPKPLQVCARIIH